MKTNHSKVMTIANKLVSQGYNRENAMIKAWVLIKLPLVETKVAGVTFGKRQEAIEMCIRDRINLAVQAAEKMMRHIGVEDNKKVVPASGKADTTKQKV